jgi:probable F420-dependent oxidoreductase
VDFGLNINHQRGNDGAFFSGLCRLAEELGFESLWSGEHVVMPVGYRTPYPYSPDGQIGVGKYPTTPDPIVALAWAAAATRRVKLGTAVLIVPQRHPLLLAKELATLDSLSGGRLLLGVGTGWLREEAEALNTEWESRGPRLDEYLAVLRRVWTEDVTSYHGRYAQFEEVRLDPKPARPAGIPIIVGGHSRAAIRRAARFGDGFWPMSEPHNLPPILEQLHREAEEAGRDPASIDVTMYAPKDLAGARRLAEMGVRRLVVWPLGYRNDLGGIKDRLKRYIERVIEPLRQRPPVPTGAR